MKLGVKNVRRIVERSLYLSLENHSYMCEKQHLTSLRRFVRFWNGSNVFSQILLKCIKISLKDKDTNFTLDTLIFLVI